MRWILPTAFVTLAFAAGLLTGGLPASAQQAPPRAKVAPQLAVKAKAPASASLVEDGTVEFPVPAPTMIQSRVQCDADGNVYVVYYLGSPQQPLRNLMSAMQNLPLTKLDMDSKEVVHFRVPSPQDYPRHYRRGFYVTPRGGVYLLLEAYKHGRDYKDGPDWPLSLVVKYKDDGSVDSVTELTLPARVHFQPSKLAVFGDGNLLVTGIRVGGPRQGRIGPLTAVFDRGGNYVAPLVREKDVWKPHAQSGGSVKAPPAKPEGSPDTSKAGLAKANAVLAITSSFMLGSPDGNIYLIRPSNPARAFVISSSGKSLRDLTINPPEGGMVPINATFGWGGQLLVEYGTQSSTRHPQMSTLEALIDPQSGSIKETFSRPRTAGAPACVSPGGEFLFARPGKNGRLEVAEYSSR